MTCGSRAHYVHDVVYLFMQPYVCFQLQRVEAKVERMQNSVTELSSQLLEAKSKEILAQDNVDKLTRELELVKLRAKAWVEQLEAEKAGVSNNQAGEEKS